VPKLAARHQSSNFDCFDGQSPATRDGDYVDEERGSFSYWSLEKIFSPARDFA
jgi:hypothetical protein